MLWSAAQSRGSLQSLCVWATSLNRIISSLETSVEIIIKIISEGCKTFACDSSQDWIWVWWWVYLLCDSQVMYSVHVLTLMCFKYKKKAVNNKQTNREQVLSPWIFEVFLDLQSQKFSSASSSHSLYCKQVKMFWQITHWLVSFGDVILHWSARGDE